MKLKKFFLQFFIYPLKSKTKLFFLRRVPPYEYVELFTINNLAQFLGLNKAQVNQCCIVGAKYGFEINPMLELYPSAFIHAFECSPRYLPRLQALFEDYDRIKVIPKAASSTVGFSKFFETNLEGNGSLLKIGKLHREWFNSKQTLEYQVETITLDEYFGDSVVDLLWIDVQGAEKLVLSGATKVLEKVKAVFIEVSEA